LTRHSTVEKRVFARKRKATAESAGWIERSSTHPAKLSALRRVLVGVD
jgi:hypothetical protein